MVQYLTSFPNKFQDFELIWNVVKMIASGSFLKGNNTYRSVSAGSDLQRYGNRGISHVGGGEISKNSNWIFRYLLALEKRRMSVYSYSEITET